MVAQRRSNIRCHDVLGEYRLLVDVTNDNVLTMHGVIKDAHAADVLKRFIKDDGIKVTNCH